MTYRTEEAAVRAPLILSQKAPDRGRLLRSRIDRCLHHRSFRRLFVLRGYLVVAAGLVLVRIAQLVTQ